MNKVIDKIMASRLGDWMLEHHPPKWLAPTLSIVSIVLSVSAMVLARAAR